MRNLHALYQLKLVNPMENLGLTGNKMRTCYTSQQDPSEIQKWLMECLSQLG